MEIDLADPVSGMALRNHASRQPRAGKDRRHLDLRPDGTTFADELDHLLARGVTRPDVGQAADATRRVLASPEGNVFCLLHHTCRRPKRPAPDAGPPEVSEAEEFDWLLPITRVRNASVPRPQPLGPPIVDHVGIRWGEVTLDRRSMDSDVARSEAPTPPNW